MKILQVVHLYPPATGGLEHHVYHLAKEFASAGYDVDVFTSKLPEAKGNETTDGVKVRRFFSISIPFFSSLRFSPSMFIAMLQSDADVFCSHGYGSPMPFFTSIAAWLRGKPFIFTLHGYPKLNGIGGLMQTFYRIFMASVYLRIARKVIIVSKVSAEDIKGEVDLKKLVYLPNGIDATAYKLTPLAGKKTITYIGRLDKYKGVDRLVRAFSKLKPKYPDLKLAIIGKDEGIKTELVAQVSSLGLGASVTFGEVPYSKIKDVYYDSLAIVLPSLYEGFPLIWLESVAAGRPIFSRRVGDYRHFYSIVYGQSSDFFLFETEDDLVQKLSNFLENQKSFEPIIANARAKLIAEFSWPKIAKDTIEVYRSTK